jgi:hypothetical protein
MAKTGVDKNRCRNGRSYIAVVSTSLETRAIKTEGGQLTPTSRWRRVEGAIENQKAREAVRSKGAWCGTFELLVTGVAGFWKAGFWEGEGGLRWESRPRDL